MKRITRFPELSAGALLLSLLVMGAGCAATGEYRTAQTDTGAMPIVRVGGSGAVGGTSATMQTGSRFQEGGAAASFQGQEVRDQEFQQAEAQPGQLQQAEAQAGQQEEWVIPLYSEQLRVDKRQVSSGEVRLRKVVKKEVINQPVELSREVLVVERVPAEAQEIARSGENAFQEREIVIDLKEEEPIIAKDLIVTGRVIARKNTQPQQETVRSEIRTEDIAVHQDVESDQIRLLGDFNQIDEAQEGLGAPADDTQVGRGQGGEMEEQQGNQEGSQQGNQ